VVLDTGGVVVGRATTTGRGDFRIALARGGTYQLRILRVGFPQTVRLGVAVNAGELQAIDVVVNAQGFAVDTATILAQTSCGARRLSDSRISSLWTAARTALLAVIGEEDAPSLDIRAVAYSGTTDTTGRLRIVQDASSLRIRDGRLSASRSSDSLAARGYVRTFPDRSESYSVPDASILASNTFAATHCFGLAPPSDEHPEWVGIAFTPARDRPGVRDVRGVIWLEHSTLLLRRVAFHYTIPGRFLDEGAGGGFVEFAKITSGRWITARWMVMADADWLGTGRIRRTGMIANWHEPVPGFFTNARRVFDYRQMIGVSAAVVLTNGAEVFRDDSALAILPAHLDGFVRDSVGHGIKGAQIRAVGSVRMTVSNDSGYFRLTDLNARGTEVAITKPGFGDASVRIDLKPDSTVHVRITLVRPYRRQ
jgi:hypothetical protein